MAFTLNQEVMQPAVVPVKTTFDGNWVLTRINGSVHGLGDIPDWLLQVMNEHYKPELKPKEN